jgi:hypothetical protein
MRARLAASDACRDGGSLDSRVTHLQNLVALKPKTQILILALAVLGRSPAKHGPGACSNGSGWKDGEERCQNQLSSRFVANSLVRAEELKCKMAAQVAVSLVITPIQPPINITCNFFKGE